MHEKVDTEGKSGGDRAVCDLHFRVQALGLKVQSFGLRLGV